VSQRRYSTLEFVLVIGVAFGLSIIGSLTSLLYGHTVAEDVTRQAFGNAHLYQVIVNELFCAPFIAAILYAGGWRLRDFPCNINRAATLLGLLAFSLAWMAQTVSDAVVAQLFTSLRGELDSLWNYRPSARASLVAVYLASIINPVFEEVIVCGYVIPVIARRYGETTAINISVLIRASYHLYQGIAVLPFHVAHGLMQAYMYVRFRNLWPLIVSHALLDFFALLYFV
jgi:membrane protease YdiL (CAAX protease family)